MMNIILSGACGRMGKIVRDSAKKNGYIISFGIDLKNDPESDFPIFPNFHDCPPPQKPSVIIDFSLPSALNGILTYATRYNCPAVLAATGYDESQNIMIETASQTVPIFKSGNMSLGICALRRTAKLLKNLLPGYDIEIVEKHHNLKKDAPSGTALAIYDSLKSEDSILVLSRAGNDQPRQKEEIGISSIRGGTVYGEHEVGFYGPDETLLLTHRAQSRMIFADGALKAAEFLICQSPGLYSMDDMLNHIF